MQRNFFRFTAALAALVFISWSCTKIDTTKLGADLLPAIDNINTFEQIVDIIASREALTDSTRIARSETHALGAINNDPVFGKTQANILVELKPTFYPYFFGKALDTINPALKASTHFDSAFLCLSYVGFYGDTSKIQHLKVYQLHPSTSNFSDTLTHRLDFKPSMPYIGNKIGEASIYPPDLRNFTFLKTSLKDSVSRQIRIKLDPSFVATLVSGDSSNLPANNFYRNDSLFKERYKGFAIVAEGTEGNGLFYINLADAATRLEVHYVASNAGKLDTAFSAFPLATGATAGVRASANANVVTRDTFAAEYVVNPDPAALYLQSAPGTAINLRIPQLDTLSNRIIHRAEIIIEQIPGGSADQALTPPGYLYLDLIDTSSTLRYKPVYYDLSPNEFYNPDLTGNNGFFPVNGIDEAYFGGNLLSKTDALGTRAYYTFNLTRYVQNLVTKRANPNYRFRVYAPYNLNYNNLTLTYKNNLAFGRVKVGSGNHPNYRMRMRIVWSNL